MSDLENKIIQAIQNNDSETVLKILNNTDIDINNTKYSYTPLFFAMYKGSVNIAKILIEHGADVNADNGLIVIETAKMPLRNEVLNLLVNSNKIDPQIALKAYQNAKKGNPKGAELLYNKFKEQNINLEEESGELESGESIDDQSLNDENVDTEKFSGIKNIDELLKFSGKI